MTAVHSESFKEKKTYFFQISVNLPLPMCIREAVISIRGKRNIFVCLNDG